MDRFQTKSMKKEKQSYHLNQIKQKYRWLRGTEILLWSVSIGLISFYLLKIYSTSSLVPASIACVLASITAIVFARCIGFFSTKVNDIAQYLNQRYPSLQESVDLLLKNDDELTSLQQIQKRRAEKQFDAIYPTIKLPHHIGRAAGVFAFSIILSAVTTSFSIKRTEKIASNDEGINATNDVKKNLPVAVRRSTIIISPPAYTRLSTKTSEDFNLQVPEASTVKWEISFNGKVFNPKIIFTGSDSISLSTHGDHFETARNFTTSGFYQLTWQNPDHTVQFSDYYSIEVIKDYPPIIDVEKLNQFLELTTNDNLKINVTATLKDDYGLSRANIIATVSKGSGEAIKFREQILAFDAPKKISGKEIKATRLIDLVKLGLQPGDELYFYVEASDNKTPGPNRTRTETYFITLQDTSSIVTSVDASLGVDLMPEYFRSQRQIIIDSEKLLRAKKQITKPDFNSRSNELGYDQKVLRLRYGEFLGEEFETSIGPQPTHQVGDDDEDMQKKFGHTHDTENEHNLVEEKSTKRNHSHDHVDTDPAQKEDPSKEYLHAHESEEEATFFIQSIKAKLKAAVTIMWDAELYLRLYQPEKSLPYQYRALKLLKEISQDSRIYVHRTGFDPPPLKEEKRLTGDLTEIKNSTEKIETGGIRQYPNIRAAIAAIERLIQEDSIVISSGIKELLENAGQELAKLELKQPGGYLKTLSWLKMVSQDEVGHEKIKSTLLNIRASFWKVLPSETMTPQARPGITHELDLQFLNSLGASKQTR